MRQVLRSILLAGAAVLVSVNAPAITVTSVKPQGLRGLEKDVRHELVMLPYYNVFDNLSYEVDGNRVILSGQVVRPTLKSDAESVVKRIEGVEQVENRVEVLPPSPFDDQIRAAEYQAIFGFSSLSRYAWGPVPALHIIVKNGNVTLEGVVANETDRNLVTIRANGVAGVFSVTNNLQIEPKS